jgi:hypothetical protein
MSEQGETAYVKEAQWRKDVWAFTAAFNRHWGWWVCFILGSPLVTIFIRARGIPIPDWILWLIGMSGVVIAAFRTWQDQKRLTEAAEKAHAEENAQLRSQLASTTKEDLINGLKFDELRALLEKQRAVEFLLKIEQKLASSSIMFPGGEPPEVQALYLRGLLDRNSIYPPQYHLTDWGRIFLNKLHAQRLASNTESPALTENPSAEAL